MKLLAKIGMFGGIGFLIYTVSILYNMFFGWVVTQGGEGFSIASLPWWLLAILITAVYFTAFGAIIVFLLRIKGFKKSD